MKRKKSKTPVLSRPFVETVPTAFVCPTSDGTEGFFAFPNLAPMRFTVDEDHKVKARFDEETDVMASYETTYAKSSWDLRLVESVAVVDLACSRADQIWETNSPNEEKIGAIALMLASLGFRINC